MNAATAPHAPTMPAWIKPGNHAIVFHGIVGLNMPMGIDQSFIESVTPFVVTLTDGRKFNVGDQTEIGEDHPFQTRIMDSRDPRTIEVMDRFTKSRAMEEFEVATMWFKSAPSPAGAQKVIDALQAFI